MIEPADIVVSQSDLRLAKSRDLVSYLASGINPDAVLIETRRDGDGLETIVFDVRLGVSQLPKYPILPVERIAVTFTPQDDRTPEVVSLREDFPRVPHLNLRETEFPRSLCLWEASFDELKLKWTSALLVERTREWLVANSAGELHQPDQPLEPLIGGQFPPLIVRRDFIKSIAEQGQDPSSYVVGSMTNPDGKVSAYWLGLARPGGDEPKLRVTLMIARERVDAGLREAPVNLKELAEICESEGLELHDELRKQLRKWKDDNASLPLHVVVVILFPKKRIDSGPVESWDTLAFFLSSSVEQLGISLGLWERTPNGTLGFLLGPCGEAGIESIPVTILNPLSALTREQAALYNGVLSNESRFVMVGVGALGSMLINLFVRKGFGIWSILDKDTFLPHNGARHLLPSSAAGFSKAHLVRNALETAYTEPTGTVAHTIDILHPSDRGVGDLLNDAQAIVDCSADVPVARYLALEAPSNGRRVSVFLNPTGEDLVVLAEDSQRRARLDVLEMQYYGLLIDTPQLESHLGTSASRFRYGRSCRDLSLVLSIDAVSRNAAIASRSLPNLLSGTDSYIGVWKGELDGGVTAYTRQSPDWHELEIDGKHAIYDERLVGKLRALRAEKLPRETGGALFGYWDHSRGILYLLGATGAPKDSREEPTGFIRGAHPELREELDRVNRITGGSAQYVGEWHSHPDGCGTRPSRDWDCKLLPRIREWLALDGSPPLMLIVGQDDLRFVMAEEGDGVKWNFPS